MRATDHGSRASAWPRVAGVCLLLATLLSACAAWYYYALAPLRPSWLVSGSLDNERVALVVASIKIDNTSWVDAFSDWSRHVYVADEFTSDPLIPVNKGREAMVYLTHIIDNWSSLASVTIFSHGEQYQWHNDDPIYDGQRVLQLLKLPVVRERGYVSLRCAWHPGCPTAANPYQEEPEVPPKWDVKAEIDYYWKGYLEQVFPGETSPLEIAAPCCAQFAVADWQIRQRPKLFYKRLRRWILEQQDSGVFSGRIVEFSWHLIFGRPAMFCPSSKECYCTVFGLCDLVCEEEGHCESQYRVPFEQTLPKDWPAHPELLQHED
nr:hypothetical protein CFP56_00333 [Quercus suber]